MNVLLSGSIEPTTAGDLRRKRSREFADVLVDRSEHLLPEDRALIQAIYRDHLTALDVAALTGKPVRHLRRRVRILVERATSPRFAFVVMHRERWPAQRRRVASAVVLQGRTWREAAKFLQTTLHAVRREMDIIGALAQQEAA